MPVTVTGRSARFDGVCTVEEALPLLEFLRNSVDPEVDLSSCTWLHTALVQLLLIAVPQMAALPADPVLARWVTPVLTPATTAAVGQNRNFDG